MKISVKKLQSFEEVTFVILLYWYSTCVFKSIFKENSFTTEAKSSSKLQYLIVGIERLIKLVEAGFYSKNTIFLLNKLIKKTDCYVLYFMFNLII